MLLRAIMLTDTVVLETTQMIDSCRLSKLSKGGTLGQVGRLVQAGQRYKVLMEFCERPEFNKVALGTEAGGPVKTVTIVASYLVGRVDVGADGGPAGLQHVWRAQRRGGHGGSALQPAVLLQIRELEASLGIHRQQPWWRETRGRDGQSKPNQIGFD